MECESIRGALDQSSRYGMAFQDTRLLLLALLAD